MSFWNAARTWLNRFVASERGEDRNPNSQPQRYGPVVMNARLVARTQSLLRSFNEPDGGREGLVYWAGIQNGRGGVVTTLIVPDAEAGAGFVRTTPSENAQVIGWLDAQHLVLLGQAHSHPPGAGARHSPGDDESTFSPFEGQISVVVPDHAAAEDDVLSTWGLHRFVDGEYRRIPDEDWHDHLRVVPHEHDRRREDIDVGATA